MKQLTLNKIISALADDPKTIGERLEVLGVGSDEAKGNFSADTLNMRVYGSSFLKFLQDNAKTFSADEPIEAEALPADFKNPFEGDQATISERLDELGLKKDELEGLFADDMLNLSVNGEEFQDFIVGNGDKFLGKLEQISQKGAVND